MGTVTVCGVSKRFGDHRALEALDLEVEEGELLALLGPSGCGKTTTLNVIAGFAVPDEGRVLIDGADVTAEPPHLRGLGVVFQSYALFPHMTVGENVAFGLRERRLPREEIRARVAEALALVRLPEAGDRRPAQLSGGMQQRVALARALVIRPRVLLLDEPLAALDRKLREEMRAELREIQRRVGITTIFVTHDQHEALGLADRIAVMKGGRIEQLGRPRDVYERPATRFVADFVGASSVVEGLAVDGATLELGAGSRLAVRLPRPMTPGARVQLLIRPERIEVPGGGPDAVVAKVVSAVYLGDHSELRLELPGGVRVLAAVRGQTAFTPGESIPVRLPPDAFLEVA